MGFDWSFDEAAQDELGGVALRCLPVASLEVDPCDGPATVSHSAAGTAAHALGTVRGDGGTLPPPDDDSPLE